MDYGVNTFSPEGRLFQVEYALKAIELGSTAIGIQTTDGVLLAVERRVGSKLMVPDSTTKIFEIDSHLGAVYSGLQADGKSLVDYARLETQVLFIFIFLFLFFFSFYETEISQLKS